MKTFCDCGEEHYGMNPSRWLVGPKPSTDACTLRWYRCYLCGGLWDDGGNDVIAWGLEQEPVMDFRLNGESA